MSLLSGFNVTLDEVRLMGEAAHAAFVGGAIPAGWAVVTPQQLGVPSSFWDGNYFTDAGSGASAIVLRQGTTTIVAFRGTDGGTEVSHFQELFSGTYINHFQPLLAAVAANTPAGSNFYFTGASLGGGATNQMADIAATQFGGRFAAAKIVAFASPNISNANGILNIGAENDPVYKLINNYANFPSSLDHLVIASPQYMAGNYDGRHPFDTYAHIAGGLGLEVMPQSVFFNLMTPDSVLIFDAVDNGLVQDVTPGRENTGVFYLGQAIGDQIAGRAGNDFIEGFGGNDTLTGGLGNDNIDGGDGSDTAVFTGLRSAYTLTTLANGLQVSGPDGTDTLTNIEFLRFDDVTIPVSGGVTPPNAALTRGSLGDFTGEGRSDILWRQDTGGIAEWQTNAAGQLASAQALGTTSTDWRIDGFGDFDGNGRSDVLFRNIDGSIAAWQTNASGQLISAQLLGSTATVWRIDGIGDFEGNGRSDILFRNVDGSIAEWQTNAAGQLVSAQLLGSAATAWHVAGIGDFDGNGRSDILFRNIDGSVAAWQTNAAGQLTSAQQIGSVANSWHVADVADFDGNGRSDILFVNDNGSVALWQTNAAGQLVSAVSLGSPGSQWHEAGTGDLNGVAAAISSGGTMPVLWSSG
jgi:FG-GAP-like repeat/RTX calcium-binding nonapeptide repeat (4 copies)